MFKLPKNKYSFATDLIFAILLGLLYLSLHFKLPGIKEEVNKLFLAAYLLLGLGILILYLASEMNPRLASIIHIGLFPFSNLIFLFVKWFPNVIPQIEKTETFSLGILAYVFLLIAYFNIQIFIHRKEPKKTRKFKSITS